MNEFNTSSYIKLLVYNDNRNEAVMLFKVTKFFLENRQDINDIFEIINEHLNNFLQFTYKNFVYQNPRNYIESFYDSLYSLISSYITYHPINLLENHVNLFISIIILKNPLCTQNTTACLVKYVQLLKPSKEEEEDIS